MRSAFLVLVLVLVAIAAITVQAQVIKSAASFTAPQAAICKPGTGIIATGAAAASVGQLREKNITPNGPKDTAGRFVSAQSCAPCAPGYAQGETGTFACQACPEGSWSATGSSKCFWCPDGTYSTGIPTDSCSECGWGTITNYYTPFIGTKFGAPVGLAPYQIKSGGAWGNSHTKCFACPADSYQPKAGQARCVDCAAGQTTNGATGQGACVAKAGGGTIVSPSPSSLLEADAEAETEVEAEVAGGPAAKGKTAGKAKTASKAQVKKGKPITKADVKPASAARTKPKIKKHPRQRYIKSVTVTKKKSAATAARKLRAKTMQPSN